MSNQTPFPPLGSPSLEHDPRRLEQLYCVPLEQPIERELFTVMAYLLSHVLNVSTLEQPEEPI
jgi:hypothetical protein